MPEFTRYAIYYAPPEGSPLATFGAAWLGWDAAAGSEVVHPDLAGLPLSVGEITERPRKYGFHGTLKPPFHLAPGTSREGLEAAVEDLAASQPAFDVPRLALRRLGSFLALVPAAASEPLRDLAAACIQKLDSFRAPPSAVELEKRRKNPLSPRQEALLAEWGYPYVLDEFRFHLTLTGPLPEAEAEQIAKRLGPVLAEILAPPMPVRELCLFGEDAADGRFHILRRFPLTG
ncbi:DUF1045 domain-containing protein [Rhodobacteraceae bacterium NNCM2]|nr:DUF1045 domain-containing protein [Coraliihabitans acroporae]